MVVYDAEYLANKGGFGYALLVHIDKNEIECPTCWMYTNRAKCIIFMFGTQRVGYKHSVYALVEAEDILLDHIEQKSQASVELPELFLLFLCFEIDHSKNGEALNSSAVPILILFNMFGRNSRAKLPLLYLINPLECHMAVQDGSLYTLWYCMIE